MSIQEKEALPELLTLRQVAEILQIPPSTLYMWRTQGRGPSAFHVGKLLRYRRGDLDAWLHEQATAGGIEA